MCLNTKGTSYIGSPTTNNITMYEDTSTNGNLTTGNTTTSGDLTIVVNFAYTGDGSYTESGIDDRFNLKMNTSVGHINIYIYI